MQKTVLFTLLLLSAIQPYAQTNKIFNVLNYGALGNGRQDDQKAIQLTIEAGHEWLLKQPFSKKAKAVIYFPAPEKQYLVGSYSKNDFGRFPNRRLRNFVLVIYSNMIFRGDDNPKKSSSILLADHLFDTDPSNGGYPNANLFYGHRVSDISFFNLTIDFNGRNNLLPVQPRNIYKDDGSTKTIYGIVIDGGGDHITIDHVTFKNNPGLNDIMMSAPGSNLLVKDCTFIDGGPNLDGLRNIHSTDFSFVYSEWDSSSFIHNNIKQQNPAISLSEGAYSGGIEVHGSYSIVSRNIISGCKPAIYISSQNNDINDHTPLQHIRITDNILMDCFNGITFWAQNRINDVVIDHNTISTMFQPDRSALVCGIYCPMGNMPCRSDYQFREGKANANQDTMSGIRITNNNIRFNSASPDTFGLSTVGILIHSFHNSVIANNTIKNMNLAGIALEGSPWGMDEVTIEKNRISDFRYCKRSGNVAGYIIVTDTYQPNSDCSHSHQPTFRHITISKNMFTPNSVVSQESQLCDDGKRNYACFKSVFLGLPAWYAFFNKGKTRTLNPEAFILTANQFAGGRTEPATLVAQDCGEPCL